MTNDLPEDVRAAFTAYRNDRSNANWTVLSQLQVGDVEVIDALRRIEPDFPDPLPLPVDGLLTDDAQFFQWPELPGPDRVLEAIVAVLTQHERKSEV